MPKPQHDFMDRIRSEQGTDCILTALKEIASHEEVSEVSIRCLDLLQSEDEEIRSWASECLSSSVQPAASEKSELLEYVRECLKKSDAGQSGPTLNMLPDQLYWASTLVGRLAISDEDAKASIRSLLNDVVALRAKIDTRASNAFAAAADRADRVLKRLG